MKEILSIPAISETESTLLDFHSIYNAIHILIGELSIYEIKHNISIDSIITECQNFARDLKFKDKSIARFYKLSELEECIRPYATDVTNAIINILKLRAQELLARQHTPMQWRVFTRGQILEDLQNFFQAVATNSKGKFGVSFSGLGKNVYYISTRIDDEVYMPVEMLDSIRDLLANSRRYSPVGTEIKLSLEKLENNLQIIITDTGIGIPEHEVESVVKFGYRASNTSNITTTGGFGLTKAFLLTKRLGGRFWIESYINIGTIIKIII
jgi:signal transduction histidine kinase